MHSAMGLFFRARLPRVAMSAGCVLVTLLPAATSQVLLWTAYGPPDAAIGDSIAAAGDLNRDGVDDILVGTSLHEIVLALSGLDGSTLFSLGPPTPKMYFGYSLAAGVDLDSDRVPDFIVGAQGGSPGNPYFPGPQPIPLNGSALVYSGADQHLIRVHIGTPNAAMGSCVRFLGDLNSDGVREYAVGSPGMTYAPATGSATVYDGATGNLLWQLSIGGGPDGFGTSIAGVPDVNADGVSDFVIAGPFASTQGLQENGILRMYSGATGGTLWTLEGSETVESVGRVLASMDEDVDGDGSGDFVAYARHGRFQGPNSCTVFSGASGAVIATVEGTPQSGPWLGQSIDSIRDLDGDGHRDVILANPIQDGGRVVLGSSATGERLFEVLDTTVFFLSAFWAYQTAAVGDLDGDGFEEWAITSIADGLNQGSTGAVWVYSLRPLYAQGATVSVSGGPQTMDMNVGMQRGGDAYLVLAGISGSRPSFFLNGGQTEVKLQPDVVTQLSITYANLQPFVSTLGIVDPATGHGTCAFDLTGISGASSAVGLHVTYVYLIRGHQVLDGPLAWYFASNPQTIEIVP